MYDNRNKTIREKKIRDVFNIKKFFEKIILKKNAYKIIFKLLTKKILNPNMDKNCCQLDKKPNLGSKLDSPKMILFSKLYLII